MIASARGDVHLAWFGSRSLRLPLPREGGRCSVAGLRCGGRRTSLSLRRGSSRISIRPCAVTQVAKTEKQEAEPSSAPTTDGVDALRLQDSVFCLRGVCSGRLRLEVEHNLRRGTTDNSYLLKDGKNSTLIDVPEDPFTDDYVAALERVVPLADISDVVLTHISPKRLPSLKALLQRWQQIKGSRHLDIHCSNPALQFIRSSLGENQDGADLLKDVSLNAARAGDSLAVGRDGRLRLMLAPTPRWPDLLYAYAPRDRLLFTSKLFSAHVAPAAVGAPPQTLGDDKGWATYGGDWRHFFDCMLAPVARQAAGVLDRLDIAVAPTGQASSPLGAAAAVLRATQAFLEASQSTAFGARGMGAGSSTAVGGPLVTTALCPLHGPVVRSSITELVGQYRAWTAEQVAASERASVAVLYASAYGNTAALAQALSRGITKAGVGVDTLNLEVTDLENVGDALRSAAGFVIGSPTLGGHMPTQVQTALGAILREARARELPCGVFGSFGWSGEAVDELESRLRDAGFQQTFPAIKVKFKPSAHDMQVAEESGTDLAQAVRKRMRLQAKQAGTGGARASAASGTEQAVGRVVGALCAVTARDADAQSAMLASWISQASFDPPGLSVAVKKDRAAEPLLVTGARFVVNVLAAGRERAIVKALSRSFGPGEDRFAELDVAEEAEGGPVLAGCAAYLKCRVQERMEAGDHWVVYAHVDGGQVLDDAALTSVHHRKTGTTY